MLFRSWPGKPLLLAGDDTALMIDRTDTLTGRPELRALARLDQALDNGSGVYKGLGALLTDPDHPIIQGPFGPTGHLGYAGDLDHVTLLSDADPFYAKDQVLTPVAWTAEDTRRTAVLLPGLYSTNTCPLYTGPDVTTAERLYRNTLAWLLDLR